MRNNIRGGAQVNEETPWRVLVLDKFSAHVTDRVHQCALDYLLLLIPGGLTLEGLIRFLEPMDGDAEVDDNWDAEYEENPNDKLEAANVPANQAAQTDQQSDVEDGGASTSDHQILRCYFDNSHRCNSSGRCHEQS